MKLIINGIFVASKEITTKKGGSLQINTIMDETAGQVVLIGDEVRIDPKTPKMLPLHMEAEVEVSNYNGMSLKVKSFHAEGIK